MGALPTPSPSVAAPAVFREPASAARLEDGCPTSTRGAAEGGRGGGFGFARWTDDWRAGWSEDPKVDLVAITNAQPLPPLRWRRRRPGRAQGDLLPKSPLAPTSSARVRFGVEAGGAGGGPLRLAGLQLRSAARLESIDQAAQTWIAEGAIGPAPISILPSGPQVSENEDLHEPNPANAAISSPWQSAGGTPPGTGGGGRTLASGILVAELGGRRRLMGPVGAGGSPTR